MGIHKVKGSHSLDLPMASAWHLRRSARHGSGGCMVYYFTSNGARCCQPNPPAGCSCGHPKMFRPNLASTVIYHPLSHGLSPGNSECLCAVPRVTPLPEQPRQQHRPAPPQGMWHTTGMSAEYAIHGGPHEAMDSTRPRAWYHTQGPSRRYPPVGAGT